MQTAIEIEKLEASKQEKILREKKWLAWLLKIWDESGREPSWITVKKNWSEEYQQILQEFGTWESVKIRLKQAYKLREQAKNEKESAERRSLRVAEHLMTYSLEDYLKGIIKVQEHLKIKRLPSLREVSQYARILAIPHGESYQRRFLKKENWAICLDRYLETSLEERPRVLEEMELELEAQKVAKRQTTKAELRASGAEVRPDKKEYDADDCLEGIVRMQAHLGLGSNDLPSMAQVGQCTKEIGTPGKKAIYRVLGKKENWGPMLVAYREKKAIDSFLATYNELEVTKTVNLSSLFERMLQVATPEEKLRLEDLAAKLKDATRNQPVNCEMVFEHKDYEVTIRPKG